MRQGHPYSVRLLNEYTDVVANGYRPGQNYDGECASNSAPSMHHEWGPHSKV